MKASICPVQGLNPEATMSCHALSLMLLLVSNREFRSRCWWPGEAQPKTAEDNGDYHGVLARALFRTISGVNEPGFASDIYRLYRENYPQLLLRYDL